MESVMETGDMLLARLETRNKPVLLDLEPNLLPRGPLSGQLVELCGVAGSGKTQYIYELTVNAILPRSLGACGVGGQCAGVILVDIDHHFSLHRLVSILENRIESSLSAAMAKQQENKTLAEAERMIDSEAESQIDKEVNVDIMPCLSSSVFKDLSVCKDGCLSVSTSACVSAVVSPVSEAEIERCITSCLQRLYIVRCTDLSQLVITLHSLEAVLTCKTDVRLIMIDSLSAVVPPSLPVSHYGSVSRTVSSLKPVCAVLQRLTAMFGLVIVTTSSVQLIRSNKRNRSMYTHSKQTNTYSHGVNMHSHGTNVKKNCNDSSYNYVSLGSFWTLPVLRLMFSRECCLGKSEVDKSRAAKSEVESSVVGKSNPVLPFYCVRSTSEEENISHKHFLVQSHGLSFILA